MPHQKSAPEFGECTLHQHVVFFAVHAKPTLPFTGTRRAERPGAVYSNSDNEPPCLRNYSRAAMAVLVRATMLTATALC